jgi:hypothetical protein
MDRSSYPWIFDRQERRATSPLNCERGGPVHKIDEVLAELLGQYRAKFPELRLSVVQTTVAAW